jgi:DedD protein
MSANHPYDDDDLPGGRYTERRADPSRADREISLGTPTILGIFFALALVCALFFGFGYTMGHKSTPPVVAAIDPVSGVSVSAPKPAAGSLAGQSPARAAQSTASASPAPAHSVPAQTATVSLVPAATPASAPRNSVTPADSMIVGDKHPTSVPQSAGSYAVQVAAVSSQDVADILIASLQKKGYTVAIRHEPQDKLLHVQIGPFPDRKDADAMRARVLSDGFNAIVK